MPESGRHRFGWLPGWESDCSRPHPVHAAGMAEFIRGWLRLFFVFAVPTLGSVSAADSSESSKPVKVFILAGQSNMVGSDAHAERIDDFPGFLGAGARSVAASLWSADDAATALLMESFYTRIAQGESTASALRGAQQRTREVYPHPYYWAAFGLVGQRERNAEMGKKRGERYAAC